MVDTVTSRSRSFDWHNLLRNHLVYSQMYSAHLSFGLLIGENTELKLRTNTSLISWGSDITLFSTLSAPTGPTFFLTTYRFKKKLFIWEFYTWDHQPEVRQVSYSSFIQYTAHFLYNICRISKFSFQPRWKIFQMVVLLLTNNWILLDEYLKIAYRKRVFFFLHLQLVEIAIWFSTFFFFQE